LLLFYYTADQPAACLLGLRLEGSQLVFLGCCLFLGLAGLIGLALERVFLGALPDFV